MSEGDVGGLWTWLVASLTLRPHLRTSGSLGRIVSPGPCRTESSDVGFDFIVVGTNKI